MSRWLRRTWWKSSSRPPSPASSRPPAHGSSASSSAGPAGPGFFGFVMGGSLPAATAADMLAIGWDQTAFNTVLSPAGAVVEECAGTWLKELLLLPAGASVGFVTGAQEANTVGLAIGRQAGLAAAGWGVQRGGLTGAPHGRGVAGGGRHATHDPSGRPLRLGTPPL